MDKLCSREHQYAIGRSEEGGGLSLWILCVPFIHIYNVNKHTIFQIF